MHCGQMGFWQTKHFSVTGTPRWRGQNFETGAVSCGCSAGLASWEIRRPEPTGRGGSAGAAAGAGAGAPWEMDRRGATGAGGGGGAAAAGDGALAAMPRSASSCWMRPLTKSEESSPHWGQTKRTGLRPMSGVTSTENLAPQEHCNFMSGLRIQQHHAGRRWNGKVQLSITGLYTAVAKKEIPAVL